MAILLTQTGFFSAGRSSKPINLIEMLEGILVQVFVGSKNRDEYSVRNFQKYFVIGR